MANASQPSSITVPIFNGENYDYWSAKMKTYFCFQDCWDVVEEGYTTPADTSALTAAQKKELKENKLKDSKALFTLQQAVTDAIFPRILGSKSAKEAWDTLKEEFQGSDKVNPVNQYAIRNGWTSNGSALTPATVGPFRPACLLHHTKVVRSAVNP
ncbi:uncharacterized protein LOC130713996 [Lotus japonicus]|uniref:uncharacterized protein LOC130713996 n=1 Tax=Lotus japonicus TaxID=34305 RepID=UPI002589117D|nr:uncharacterized protein LOC130713996 [Lotus japonicus]